MKQFFIVAVFLPSVALAQEQAAPSAPPAAATETAKRFGSSCPYPELAQAAHIQGNTLISYLGTDDGQIEDVTIVQTSGNYDLDAATVQCVSRWRFDPLGPSAKFNIGTHEATIAWVIQKYLPAHSKNQPPASGSVCLTHVRTITPGPN